MVKKWIMQKIMNSFSIYCTVLSLMQFLDKIGKIRRKGRRHWLNMCSILFWRQKSFHLFWLKVMRLVLRISVLITVIRLRVWKRFGPGIGTGKTTAPKARRPRSLQNKTPGWWLAHHSTNLWRLFPNWVKCNTKENFQCSCAPHLAPTDFGHCSSSNDGQ